MPRIRSIKPEFWTDETVAELPADTALFFIGLWTHSDDYGFFPCTPSALALLLPRWKPQVIEPMLSRLEKDGLVKVSRRARGGAGVGLVVGWEHQKIKDRRVSKWTDKEISWDEPGNNAPKSEKNRPRSGEERKGEERSVIAPPAPATLVAEVAPKTSDFIAKYCELFKAKYGTNPSIQGRDSGIAKRLLKTMAIDKASFLLEAYFAMPDAWIEKAKHPLMIFDAKINEVVVFANSGRFTTMRQARQKDDLTSSALLLQQVRAGEV